MEMTQGCSPDPAASLPGWEPCTPTLPAHPASSPWEQSCFVHPRGGFEAVDVTLGWQGAATWPCTPHWALALPSIQLKLFLDHCSPRVLHISLILAAGRAEEQSRASTSLAQALAGATSVSLCNELGAPVASPP